MDRQEVVRRLVFIKYLYNEGVRQSRKPRPYSWSCILTFHDTVELFLLAAAEFVGVSEQTLRNLTFTNYWDYINPKLREKGTGELTQRLAMERLNGVRREFKHHGTPPSAEVIDSARENVGNFLEENSEILFKVRFSDISLIDLVLLEEAKTNLQQAIELKETDRESSIDKTVLAFHQLVDDYVDRKRDGYGRSMFDFAGFSWYDSWHKLSKELADVQGAFRDLERSVGQLNEITKMMVLGFDIRKYLRFETLTAREIERVGKEYAMRGIERKVENSITSQDIQFCIDFVIECAIILQEGDFEFRPKKYRTLADIF